MGEADGNVINLAGLLAVSEYILIYCCIESWWFYVGITDWIVQWPAAVDIY